MPSPCPPTSWSARTGSPAKWNLPKLTPRNPEARLSEGDRVARADS